ncbi:hypothetical protein Bca4012_040010 [Brassica carinata]|uniref:Uncharacterized protein n=1 Tax=Brassica carinata TaxID=52824 RepID=A0A8X7WBI9_BRACI|nr:hypothetical protein Bca52824_008211 [Brassica carinata]
MEDRHVSPAVLYIQVSVFQEQYKIVTLADYRLLEARAGNARSFVDDPAETDDMSGRLSPFAAELSLANRIKLYYYADPYEQYPSPLFGGVEHVKIPADGDAIYLVGYSPMKCYRNVVVTLELVMDTMIEYSDQFGLGEELESAMIIACSLRQNRYLEKVGLPAVLSNCDLIYPALTEPETGGGVREKPTLSKKAAVMLGRFHQMSCLVLFKDFDTSFRNDTDRDWTMSSLFSMHEGRILTEYEMSGGILPASSDLIWLRFLNNEESMARLRKHSVFEGFWLVKERSRLRKLFLVGVILNENAQMELSMLDCLALGGLTEAGVGGFFHPHTRVHRLPTLPESQAPSSVSDSFLFFSFFL